MKVYYLCHLPWVKGDSRWGGLIEIMLYMCSRMVSPMCAEIDDSLINFVNVNLKLVISTSRQGNTEDKRKP